jgi:branched-chain amino acid transport system substrate-binding protein
MNRPWQRVVAGVAVGSVIAGLAACSSSGGSQSTSAAGTGSAPRAGSSCSATGVTGNSIEIGGIASLSGSYAASLSPIADGMRARIDAQNAEGGVNGRKINFDVADDQSTVDGNLAASRELVEG